MPPTGTVLRRPGPARVTGAGAPPVETLEDDINPDQLQAEDHQRAVDSRAPAMESFESFDDMIVRDADTDISLPLVEGARVVFMGNSRRFSQPLRGAMTVEDIEMAPAEYDAAGVMTKKGEMFHSRIPQEVGTGASITSYDFASHDSRGKLILSRLMPSVQEVPDGQGGTVRMGVPAELRGKPFNLVEHPEHLRIFHRMRDVGGAKMFTVLVPHRFRGVFLNYMSDVERKIGRERAEEEYTMNPGRRGM